jgi:ABC-2 type transport system ATP-binding protein
MTDAADRRIETYSKGMRQRVRVAAALVHEPPVLLLDEPFNGMDPRQRLQLMEVLRRLAAEGRSVLFSSHILEEVEQVAGSIQVMVAGRHAASGDFREIRRLMTERPHQYLLRSSDNRALASAIIADGSASGIRLVGGTRGARAPAAASSTAGDGAAAADGAAIVGAGEEPALHVEASDYGRFVHSLPVIARELDVHLYEVSPSDESLESVFSYLVNR